MGNSPENERPTALILSRQKVADLPSKSGDRRRDAEQTKKGAYVLADCEGKPDVVLIASGSEVATLVEGAKLLEADGIKVRIVSVPSEGLLKTRSRVL